MDIAAGMDYLHSLGVLHSDLKAANVLLTSKQPSNYDPRGFVCKVTDFGLSRCAPRAPPPAVPALGGGGLLAASPAAHAAGDPD
jgi:serine/threonine protein kinase